MNFSRKIYFLSRIGCTIRIPRWNTKHLKSRLTDGIVVEGIPKKEFSTDLWISLLEGWSIIAKSDIPIRFQRINLEIVCNNRFKDRSIGRKPKNRADLKKRLSLYFQCNCRSVSHLQSFDKSLSWQINTLHIK